MKRKMTKRPQVHHSNNVSIFIALASQKSHRSNVIIYRVSSVQQLYVVHVLHCMYVANIIGSLLQSMYVFVSILTWVCMGLIPYGCVFNGVRGHSLLNEVLDSLKIIQGWGLLCTSKTYNNLPRTSNSVLCVYEQNVPASTKNRTEMDV